MTGCNNGVGVRLQRVIPFLQCIHCIAHRLALCSADSANDVDYPDMAEMVVNNISAFFNRSGKRTHELKKLASELQLSRTKIVKSGKTRWLSRGQAVSVIIQLFCALARLLASVREGDETVRALHHSVTTYMFAGVLASVVDILAMLSLLSQSFQQDTLDYTTINQRLSQVRETIVDDYIQFVDPEAQCSPNLSYDDWSNLWNRLVDEGNGFLKEPSGDGILEFLIEDGVYKGVQLHSKDKSELLKWLSKYAVSVMSRLAERFPEDSMDVFSALEIFNPSRLSSDPALLRTYGDTEIKVLCDWYGRG